MTRDRLRQVVADVLEVEPEQLCPETDLITIETFDSVGILTLMIALDEQAGIKLGPSDMRDVRYYRDIESLAEGRGVALTD
jgi:acyl carrier protein